jgi:hypothetical protein
MTATDQLELGVGQSVETRQGAVVERSGEVGELVRWEGASSSRVGMVVA